MASVIKREVVIEEWCRIGLTPRQANALYRAIQQRIRHAVEASTEQGDRLPYSFVATGLEIDFPGVLDRKPCNLFPPETVGLLSVRQVKECFARLTGLVSYGAGQDIMGNNEVEVEGIGTFSIVMRPHFVLEPHSSFEPAAS